MDGQPVAYKSPFSCTFQKLPTMSKWFLANVSLISSVEWKIKNKMLFDSLKINIPNIRWAMHNSAILPFFSIRGRLGSSVMIFRNIGTLIGYVLGATIEYKLVPCICIIIPIAFIVIFMMIPNTPRYYLHKGQIQVSYWSLLP